MTHLRRILMVAVVLTLAITGAAFLGGNDDERTTFDVEFNRTFNLFEGSRVRVVGVDVGRVEEVLAAEGASKVVVRISLDPDVEVPEDAHAAIVQGALLGERYIQLFPPHTEGPTLESGATIPVERTRTPVEFEESFEALSDALETLEPDEVGRLVTNLAGTLDGQGESLGEMLESVRDLISALRDSDDELVDLARTLADLNETIGTRAEQIAQQYVDLGLVAESLASERAGLRRTLDGLQRMSFEVGDLLETHRPTLEEDIPTITRLVRTLERNLDIWPDYLEGQAEVYRHGARGVAEPERNWGYTRNHYDAIPILIAHRVQNRLIGLCSRLEIEGCADAGFWDGVLDDEMCLPGLIPCPEDGDAMSSVAEELERAFEEVPELRDRLEEERQEDLDGDVGGLRDLLPSVGGMR